MSMPPNDSPSELLARLSTMPRPFEIVDFPRRGKDGEPIGRVALRILTQVEQTRCAAEAERYTRKLFGADLAKSTDARRGYDDVFANESAVQLLAVAVRHADDPDKAFFPNAESIRTYLTCDEIAVLLMGYFSVQKTMGPIISEMTEPEVDAWLQRLEAGARGAPFSALSQDALTDLARSLARRLLSYSTATSFAGSLTGESTPESSKAGE